MRAALGDPSAVDHEDHVGLQDGGEPVRDGDRRPALHQRLQRRLHQALRVGVEAGRRLVQDQDARVLQDHARDREALLLAARELVPALPHDRVVPLGELDDPVVDVGGPGGGLQLLLGRVGLAVQQVAADRRVEQVRLLRDHADHVADRLERDLPHVDAVDLDGALLHVVEAGHQVRDRGLAGAARTDERRELTRAGSPGRRRRASTAAALPGPRSTRRRFVRRRDRDLVGRAACRSGTSRAACAPARGPARG